VFDIVAAELEPKPSPQTYARFLRAHAVDPARAAMFEIWRATSRCPMRSA